MPVGWKPKTSKLEELMAEEEARVEALQTKRQMAKVATLPQVEEPQTPTWIQPQEQVTFPEPVQTQPSWMPQVEVPEIPEPRPMPQLPAEKPSLGAPKGKVKEEPLIPLWQRALQVFSAPFEWVGENIIRPAESLALAPLAPNLPREVGESYTDWKKREWEAWESPGFDIKVAWSDKPWRIDLRGVLEFAPWLFIPGAGQVGSGAKAGLGIAGFLGKARPSLVPAVSRVGRMLGKAVEYSPWGLVEKTAGKAMGAGIKGIAAGSEKLGARVFPKAFEKPPIIPSSPEAVKLTKVMKEKIIPARLEFEEAIPRLRAEQRLHIQEVTDRLHRGDITIDKWKQLMEELKLAPSGGVEGQFRVKPLIAKGLVSAEDTFAPQEVKNLTDEIARAMEKGVITRNKEFIERNADIALRDLIFEGKLPQPAVIRDWAKIFGQDFADAVSKLKGVKATTLEKWIDALNLPRALLASTDLSAVGRQGLILSVMHPTKVPKWFMASLKSFSSEKWAVEADDILRSSAIAQRFAKNDGYLAPVAKGINLGAREETFMSSLAEKIPFVRRSERAFITYLNEARVGAYEAASNAWIGATDDELKVLSRFINLASGRGDIPQSLEKFAPVLNTILFSPRLQMSRLELPKQLIKMALSKNPYMRKEANRALITFLGGGASLLTLLKLSGAAKVEIDPRSADFGKIRFREGVDSRGNPKYSETRFDIWTGYVQYLRFITQMITQQQKTAFGNMNKAQRDQLVWRFIQSKSSPAVGLFVDTLKGETYMGDEIFKDTKSFMKQLKERMMPLALQDTLDAIEQNGINSAWTAIPASLGIGVLTYVNDFVQTQDRIAKSLGYESWSEIDPLTQRRLQNSNAELQAAYIELDRQVMGTAWGDWRSAGNAVEENFKENVNNAVDKYRKDGDGVAFRGKVTDAWTERRGGYDTRQKDLRFAEQVKRLNTQNIMEAEINLGPEQLAIKTYDDALFGEDMYDEFGDYRFDEANLRKEQLQQQMGTEMFSYVEQYHNSKFEDLPPEFQELQKAKQIMKPYWDVKNRVIKLFGQRFADSSGGQSLISKRRKALRFSNPEIARAYETFYKE